MRYHYETNGSRELCSKKMNKIRIRCKEGLGKVDEWGNEEVAYLIKKLKKVFQRGYSLDFRLCRHNLDLLETSFTCTPQTALHRILHMLNMLNMDLCHNKEAKLLDAKLLTTFREIFELVEDYLYPKLLPTDDYFKEK